MLNAGSLALAAAWALFGPPKLPPLPGEQAPPPIDAGPAKPTAAPAKPSGPAPQKPAAPTTTTTGEAPPGTPRSTVPVEARATPPLGIPTAPPPATGPGQPEVMEPPQPETSGPALAPTQQARPRGSGAAPVMGAERLPGDDEDERPRMHLPPPQRPPYSGVGLFIGAGISFSAALSEQIVAHVLVKRRCIDPFANPVEPDPMDPEQTQTEAEELGDALLRCAPGVLPALALRVYSDLGLLATIGLASAGAVLRARRDAYDDVFGDRPARPRMGLRVAGISLIGAGVVTWLTTGALSWGLLASCRDAQCATRTRLMAFTTRDTGALLIAAGSGMVGYALAHRRAYDHFHRERAISVGTALLPGGAGLSLSGRF